MPIRMDVMLLSATSVHVHAAFVFRQKLRSPRLELNTQPCTALTALRERAHAIQTAQALLGRLPPRHHDKRLLAHPAKQRPHRHQRAAHRDAAKPPKAPIGASTCTTEASDPSLKKTDQEFLGSSRDQEASDLSMLQSFIDRQRHGTMECETKTPSCGGQTNSRTAYPAKGSGLPQVVPQTSPIPLDFFPQRPFYDKSTRSQCNEGSGGAELTHALCQAGGKGR